MSTKNAQKEQKKESLITTHWGDDATIHGWTAIPNSLLMLQGDLGIGSTAVSYTHLTLPTTPYV